MSGAEITRDTWDFSVFAESEEWLLQRAFFTEYAYETLSAIHRPFPRTKGKRKTTKAVEKGASGLGWFEELVAARTGGEVEYREEWTTILRPDWRGRERDWMLSIVEDLGMLPNEKDDFKFADVNLPQHDFLSTLSKFAEKELVQCRENLGNIIPLEIPWSFPDIPPDWYSEKPETETTKLLKELGKIKEGSPFMNREDASEVLVDVVEREEERLQLKFYLPYQFSPTNFCNEFEMFIHSDVCAGRFRRGGASKALADRPPREFFNLRDAPDFSFSIEYKNGVARRVLAGAYFMDVPTAASKQLIKKKFRELLEEFNLPKGKRTIGRGQHREFFQSRLKALGVYRLAKSPDVRSVSEFCQEQRTPLYEQDSQYSHAKMQAVFIMRSLFAPAMTTAHFST